MRGLSLESSRIVLSCLPFSNALTCRMVCREWKEIVAEEVFRTLYLWKSPEEGYEHLHKSIKDLYQHPYAHLVKTLIYNQQNQQSMLHDLEYLHRYVPNLEELEITKAGIVADSSAMRKNISKWSNLKQISIPSGALLLANTLLKLPECRLTSIEADLFNANKGHIKMFFDSIRQASRIKVLRIKAYSIELCDLYEISRGANMRCLKLVLESFDGLLTYPLRATILPTSGVKELTISYGTVSNDTNMRLRSWFENQLAYMYPNVESFTFIRNEYSSYATRLCLNIADLVRQWQHLHEITLGAYCPLSSSYFTEALGEGPTSLQKIDVYFTDDYQLNMFLSDLSSSKQRLLTSLSVRNVLKFDQNAIRILSGSMFQNMKKLEVDASFVDNDLQPDVLYLLLKELTQLEMLTLILKMSVPFSHSGNNYSSVNSNLRHLDISFEFLFAKTKVLEVYNNVVNKLLSQCTHLYSLRLNYYLESMHNYDDQFCIDLRKQHNVVDFTISNWNGSCIIQEYLAIKGKKIHLFTREFGSPLRPEGYDQYNVHEPIMIFYEKPFLLGDFRFE